MDRAQRGLRLGEVSSRRRPRARSLLLLAAIPSSEPHRRSSGLLNRCPPGQPTRAQTLDRVLSPSDRLRLRVGLSQASTVSRSTGRGSRSRTPRRLRVCRGARAVSRSGERRSPNLSGDCNAELPLQFEHASRLAVIGLGPYLSWSRARISFAVTRNRPLSARTDAFHQILDAQLLTDLRERLRSALVAPGRCPTLHN